MLIHICIMTCKKKKLIIFAHAGAESLSVRRLDVLVERVVVDQFEEEAAVATLSSTFGKFEPSRERLKFELLVKWMPFDMLILYSRIAEGDIFDIKTQQQSKMNYKKPWKLTLATITYFNTHFYYLCEKWKSVSIPWPNFHDFRSY